MFRMQLRRRAEQRTSYRKRLRLLLGRKNRVVVRRSLSGFTIQLVKYSDKGDNTLLETTTKHLRQYGWKGHGGSIPSAYLTGLLFGKIAAKKGFGGGVIDFGLQSKDAQTLLAAAIGARDGGLNIPVGAEIPVERLKGGHIAQYARHLKTSSPDKYNKQFSAYMKAGLDPETLPQHFEDVKKKIEEL